MSEAVEVAYGCYRLSCNRAACANNGNFRRPWHYLLEERTQRYGFVALYVCEPEQN